MAVSYISQNLLNKLYQFSKSKLFFSLSFFSKKILRDKSEELKDEDTSGEGIPTKAHLRFTMNEDPLF
jgi:hypothetical protein